MWRVSQDELTSELAYLLGQPKGKNRNRPVKKRATIFTRNAF